MNYKIIFFIVFAFISQLALGQKPASDSLAKPKSDSLNTVMLNEYNTKLQEIEEQRAEDSLKKAELESKLSSLSTVDNFKKEELLQQIEELNSQEKNRLAEKKAQIDALRMNAKSFPVTGFFNDTLFQIYSKLGSFSASDRASAISSRIEKIADNFKFKNDSLKLEHVETTIDIVFDESIIMSVSENDAVWNNTSKDSLALKYRNIIAAEVAKYKSETSYITLAKEVGLALVVLIVLGLILRYVGKFFRLTAKKIEQQEGNRIKGIKIKNYTLFDAQRAIKVLLTINTVIKWIVILICIYIALPILFNIFPWTQNFAQTLFGYVLDPLKRIFIGIWHYLPNLMTILVIFFVFKYVLKGVHFLKNEVENENLTLNGFYPDWANPTFQILRVILYAFMFVLIFPYLPGSDSPVFKGVSVFLGFLFTFGSAGSLSNVIAGLVLTYMRLFKIGDRVKIGDVVGDVIEKSLLVTRVRTIKNEIISIPNSTVMSSHTINYSSETNNKGLIMHSTVTIGYDVPWKAMHQALLTAADRTSLFLKDPKPFVLQTSLDDFYVSYQINAYTKEPNKQASIYSELHQNIQDCCNEAGIEILSPHYRAARDGNMTTIPADYLAKDYKAPNFNFTITQKDK
jgi:small-conductance mechanosensitive channel